MVIGRSTTVPLSVVDIVMSVYNQERVIDLVLDHLFKNTITPFNLILVFDGCTDRTRERALAYLRRHTPSLMRSIRLRETPNLYETKANNIGFRLASSPFMITVQDDMLIKERGWEVRLTYPLRTFENVLAVTARIAQDIDRFDTEGQHYIHRAGRELLSLRRHTFAIRDIINRGPIAFRMDYLRELNYLNEAYAPSDLDDADLALRAWKEKGLVCGAFWIDYVSPQGWGKAKSKDSTMGATYSLAKNALAIVRDHGAYIDQAQKHSENVFIGERDIDYPANFDRVALRKQQFYSDVLFARYFIADRCNRIWQRNLSRGKSVIRMVRKIV